MTSAVTAALDRPEEGDRTRVENRSVEVDAIRAIAAIAVVVSHGSGLALINRGASPAQFVLGTGGQGVLLFFVLSGYLIGGPFVRALVDGHRMPAVGAYGLRRVARIFPAYWVAFVALLLLAPVAVLWWQWPVHLLLLQSWVPRENGAVFFVAWSLGFEATFYVFVPLAAWVASGRLGGSRLNMLAVISLAAWIAGVVTLVAADAVLPTAAPGSALEEVALFGHNGPLLGLTLFAPGVLVALASTAAARQVASGPWAAYRALVRRPALAFPVLAVLLVVAEFAALRRNFVVRDAVSHNLFWLASALFLAIAVEAGSWTRAIARVLAPVGVISYGIYLWHWVFKSWLDATGSTWVRHGDLSASLFDTALLLALTLPAAAASWLLIEKPAMRWAADRVKRQRAVRPAAASHT
jgi:peptidoglycan/LPS O-acetylase OafA/YrhL